MWKEYVEKVRESKPLIHNITNYVTVNDCANILLASGASPIMADAKEEVEDITSICDGLNLNIGTLNSNTIESMILAGKESNRLKHPVVLDPVGAGASKLRTTTAGTLMQEIAVDVIRGNISEIKALALGTNTVQGVDAAVTDEVTKDNLQDAIRFIQEFANTTNTIVAVTGAIDIVADKDKAYVIYNGHSMMSDVTGTGCMLSAVITAYLAANSDSKLEATATAVIGMGICGEMAHERLAALDGNASYRSYIMDRMYHLDGETLRKKAKYEIY